MDFRRLRKEITMLSVRFVSSVAVKHFVLL